MGKLWRIGYDLTRAGPREARDGDCKAFDVAFAFAVFAELAERGAGEVDGDRRPALIADPAGSFDDMGRVEVTECDAAGDGDEGTGRLVEIALTVAGCEPICECRRNSAARGGFFPTKALAFISSSCSRAALAAGKDFRWRTPSWYQSA